MLTIIIFSDTKSSRPTSEDIRHRLEFQGSEVQSRGDSSMLLDSEVGEFMDQTIQEPQVHTIYESDPDLGVSPVRSAKLSESITINVMDEAGNAIYEDLVFENKPATPRYIKTLPREPAKPFREINDKMPRSKSEHNGKMYRSISATEKLKMSSPPIRRRDLKPVGEAHARRSKTPNSIYLIADEIRRQHDLMKNRCTSIPASLGNKSLNKSLEFHEKYQQYNSTVIEQPELKRFFLSNCLTRI